MSRITLQAALGALEARIKENKKIADESSIISVVDKFLVEVGGAEQLGKMLCEDFMDLRNASGSAKRPKLVLEYYKLFRPLLEARDNIAKSLADMSNLSNDDLQGVLSQLAFRMISDDRRLRAAALLEAAQNDPAGIDSMIEMLKAVKAGDLVEIPEVVETQAVESSVEREAITYDPDDPANGYDPDAELDMESKTEMELSSL